MPELHDLLERRASVYDPDPELFDRVLDRRRRRERNRRVASALVALLVAGLVIGGLLRAFSSDPVPADPAAKPFLGAWNSVNDDDGGTHRMVIRASANGAVEIMVTDEFAAECSGSRSAMRGTGRADDTMHLVIPDPVDTCDDGSTPDTINGTPLRNWTLSYDAQHDLWREFFDGFVQ